MKKHFVFLFLMVLLVSALAAEDLVAQSQSRSGGGVFMQGASTASQKGIFAVYLAVWPERGFDAAMSLSNTLAAPTSIQNIFDITFGDLEGTLEFYLWDLKGDMYTYETGPESPGRGLNDEGMLSPGRSYLVLLSEILKEVEYPFEENDGIFAGYAWVIGNFDGIQGTANPTDFKLFTQTTVMQPDLGSTFFDFSANAGVPLAPPTEEPQ